MAGDPTTFDDVQEISDLIRRRIGVNLKDAQDMGSLERFVAARVRALELPHTTEYVKLLSRQNSQGPELARVIAAVTNPHTFFFRDGPQFAAARFLLNRRKEQKITTLTLWTAGCATGEEPYSLAMLCMDLGIDAKIVASDVNPEVLRFAREGVYKKWSLRHCPDRYVKRFFKREGELDYRVVTDVRKRVSFRRHNLVEEEYPGPAAGGVKWNWIFCRNVLLYFDRPTVRYILQSFSRVLNRDGWLFLSTAEHLHGLKTPFGIVEVAGSFGYRHDAKASEPPPPGFAAASLERASPFDTIDYDEPLLTPPPAVLPLKRGELAAAGKGPAQENAPEVRGAAGPAVIPPAADYDHAVALASAGEMASARATLEAYLKSGPDDLAALVTLGNVCLRTHDFESALKAYQLAQDRDPLLPEVHYLEGVVYRKLGDLPRAIAALRRALFLEPRFWHAAFLLAGIYGRTGEDKARRRNLAVALSLLAAGHEPSPFLSFVEGMKDLELHPKEAKALCENYLTEDSAPSLRDTQSISLRGPTIPNLNDT